MNDTLKAYIERAVLVMGMPDWIVHDCDGHFAELRGNDEWSTISGHAVLCILRNHAREWLEARGFYLKLRDDLHWYEVWRGNSVLSDGNGITATFRTYDAALIAAVESAGRSKP